MKWIARKRSDVICRWKADKIGYMAAVSELVALGLSLDTALALIEHS